MSALDDALEIDRSDPLQDLALRLVAAQTAWIASLVAMRQAQNLSQTDVARRMGCTQSSVSDIETGSTDPRLSTLRRYALAVGADVEHTVRQYKPRPAVVSVPRLESTESSMHAQETHEAKERKGRRASKEASTWHNIGSATRERTTCGA